MVHLQMFSNEHLGKSNFWNMIISRNRYGNHFCSFLPSKLSSSSFHLPETSECISITNSPHNLHRSDTCPHAHTHTHTIQHWTSEVFIPIPCYLIITLHSWSQHFVVACFCTTTPQLIIAFHLSAATETQTPVLTSLELWFSDPACAFLTFLQWWNLSFSLTWKHWIFNCQPMHL